MRAPRCRSRRRSARSWARACAWSTSAAGCRRRCRSWSSGLASRARRSTAGASTPASATRPRRSSMQPGWWARLIVLCTHTAAARPTAVLGRTALGVLHAAPCPVVLVPPAPRLASWRPNRILLPHDGSPTANAVVGPAAELACKAGAELLVVQVGTAGIGAPAERGSLSIPLYVDQPQHEWPSWSGEMLERLACRCPDVRLRAHLYVRGGEPGPEITRAATENRPTSSSSPGRANGPASTPRR